MPNVILEAMLYGMPILATAMGAVPEIVVHGTNGFVSDTPDPNVFADWIIRLATDAELRTSMARTNHEQASRLYTSQRVRVRMRAIIDACLVVSNAVVVEQSPPSEDSAR
jgi:glycosyltransferase involved in cell wall biosynthesis